MGRSTAHSIGTALVALAVAGAALSAIVMLARPALAAATFTVTKTADTNDGACTAGDCSLREAIIAANATSGAEIAVPAGTYKLTIAGAGEDLAATGDLDIRTGMTITGAGALETIIDGGGLDRVIDTPILFPTQEFTVTISGVTITGGVTQGTGGGIRHTARSATLILAKSAVRGNRAAQGGGIQSGGSQGFGETVMIQRSTISGNQAPGGQGGGIQNTENLTLENTTVSGNRSRFGGGIMQQSGTGTLQIADSTIAFNRAQQPGGGIFINGGDPEIKNSIVSHNRSDFASGKNCSESVTSLGNNLEKGTTCGFAQASDQNADPQLGSLQDNGGPTNTHALLQGSPAIDAGGAPFPNTDQRGVGRPQGEANDIGAYEKKRRRR